MGAVRIIGYSLIVGGSVIFGRGCDSFFENVRSYKSAENEIAKIEREHLYLD